MRRLGRAMHAFWIHDLSEQLSYPMLFIQRLITGATLLFLLYFGSALVDGGEVVGELGAPYFLFEGQEETWPENKNNCPER
jgi:hypothetical protein